MGEKILIFGILKTKYETKCRKYIMAGKYVNTYFGERFHIKDKFFKLYYLFSNSIKIIKIKILT